MASKVPNCCFSLKRGCNVLAALIFLCGVGGLTAGIEIANTVFIFSGSVWTITSVFLMVGVK